MPQVKVNGGIITDQMLSGSLKYFKMVGDFAPTVSAGTVNIDSASTGGASITTYFVVGSDETPRPVPGSLADIAIRAISERCGIVSLAVIGTVGAEAEIHFAAANTSFAWLDENGDVDTDAMAAAVAEVGATVTVPNVSGGTDDPTATPVTKDASTTVTITEVPFALA